MVRNLRLTIAAAGGIPMLGLGAWALPVQATTPTTPFSLSGIAAESRQPSVATTPHALGTTFRQASTAAGTVSVGTNVDVIGSSDVTQQAVINDVSVKTCNPGKNTAQNETTIAANSTTLVGGANDYRLYEPSENRYDSSGGYYVSSDGGKSWSAGFLPDLVRANPTAPGPYESAGDPAVVAGANGYFWYSNIAFDRTDNANAVAVSRSKDNGQTWSTHYVVQTSAVHGKALFNDKEWIGADPNDPNIAYVTWTEFQGASSAIVISKTTDGGVHWSAPQLVSSVFTNDQGSTVVVDASGNVYVTFETFNGSTDAVVFSKSTDGGASFTSTQIAAVQDIPSPLPNATFRDDSFPALALDGQTLHVVWSNWNGTDADVLYMRSTDAGNTWNGPVKLAGGAGDQFFPWIAARSGKVFASWYNRAAGGGDVYSIAGTSSSDGGSSWTAPVTISSVDSNVQSGNQFSFPSCLYNFIGDYNAITVDSNGVGHALWTDIRKNHFDPSAGGADQDPFTATLS
jgi:hypothetical protein